ncbi:hypothetical protein HMPREF9246_0815 [Anaerococcus hydrogenalis ACS-025-V-Sch4]|uniref:Uncharacterized protein n=1 Tax=Anaerococcus hydrogenalis ACS-025-V-Sch4 TaxID=879306 RepID=F0GYK8_9FIRM|nr:hypothetical protein HMPREF9246_0815 [Anaerococcus hydrogenalis ACS-025-V-Sch4]
MLLLFIFIRKSPLKNKKNPPISSKLSIKYMPKANTIIADKK